MFFELTALSLPTIITIILPAAAFAAAIYVTNRLSGDSELAILRAGGVATVRLARPFFMFAGIVMALQLTLQHILVPESRGMLKTRQAEIAENTTARLLVEGVFVNPNPTSTFYIKNITEEGELRSVFLADYATLGIARTYSATRAFLVKSDSGPKLVMIDGTMEQYSALRKTA